VGPQTRSCIEHVREPRPCRGRGRERSPPYSAPLIAYYLRLRRAAPRGRRRRSQADRPRRHRILAWSRRSHFGAPARNHGWLPDEGGSVPLRDFLHTVRTGARYGVYADGPPGRLCRVFVAGRAFRRPQLRFGAARPRAGWLPPRPVRCLTASGSWTSRRPRLFPGVLRGGPRPCSRRCPGCARPGSSDNEGAHLLRELPPPGRCWAPSSIGCEFSQSQPLRRAVTVIGCSTACYRLEPRSGRSIRGAFEGGGHLVRLGRGWSARSAGLAAPAFAVGRRWESTEVLVRRSPVAGRRALVLERVAASRGRRAASSHDHRAPRNRWPVLRRRHPRRSLHTRGVPSWAGFAAANALHGADGWRPPCPCRGSRHHPLVRRSVDGAAGP